MESGECLHTLLGHTAEIVSLNFDTDGQRIMTGSFDHTVKGKRVGQLCNLACLDRGLRQLRSSVNVFAASASWTWIVATETRSLSFEAERMGSGFWSQAERGSIH